MRWDGRARSPPLQSRTAQSYAICSCWKKNATCSQVGAELLALTRCHSHGNTRDCRAGIPRSAGKHGMASKTEELRTFSLPTQPRCSAALPSVQSSSIARDLQPGTNSHHPPVISGCASPQGTCRIGFIHRWDSKVSAACFVRTFRTQVARRLLQSAQDTRAGLVLMMHLGAGAQCDFWAC